MITMKLTFFLPLYKNTTKMLEVTDENGNIAGSLKKFNDNKLLNNVGKHISNKFVSNVKIHSLDGLKNYQIRTIDQIGLFYKMGRFSIWNGDTKIGNAKEQRKLGIAIHFSIGKGKYRAASKIESLRTIRYYSMFNGEEKLIAIANRSQNPKLNKMELEIFDHSHLDPMLLIGICYLHTIVK